MDNTMDNTHKRKASYDGFPASGTPNEASNDNIEITTPTTTTTTDTLADTTSTTTATTTSSTEETTTTPKTKPMKPIPILNQPRLFDSNLNYSITTAHLEKLFSKYGTVVSVTSVFNKQMNHSGDHFQKTTPKGFMFVSMGDLASAQLAMTKLHGRKLLKRNLVVKPARNNLNDKPNNNNEEESNLNPAAKKQKLDSRIEKLRAALGD